MKALTMTDTSISRELLLRMAKEIPGAWIGIRISAYLLLLSGWKSSQIASLFGVSRWSVVKWIHKANEKGVDAPKEGKRSGRPPKVDENCRKALEEALSKSPKEFGIHRASWSGVVVVEYLKRVHGVKIHVVHAQRLIRKLGYTLKRPVYRYIQAQDKGVKEFREAVKKSIR